MAVCFLVLSFESSLLILHIVFVGYVIFKYFPQSLACSPDVDDSKTPCKYLLTDLAKTCQLKERQYLRRDYKLIKITQNQPLEDSKKYF